MTTKNTTARSAREIASAMVQQRYELAYSAFTHNDSPGHRYWWLHDSTRSEAPPRLTISDGSGEYPHECDDGLLYVSADGPTIEEGYFKGKTGKLFERNPKVSIPLIDLSLIHI